MTTSWTTPEDVVVRIRRAWDRGDMLAARLGRAEADPLFPMKIAVSRPSSRTIGEQFGAVRAWISRLEEGSRTRLGHGYEIEWDEINHRQLGRNRVPRRVVIPTEADALALLGVQSAAARWDHLVGLAVRPFPQLKTWIQRGPHRLLDLERDWEQILAVLDWFQRSPRSGVYLRQIDVPGIDSKFIESRRALLGELLDLVLPAERIDASAAGARAFEQRYGLQAKPLRLRVRSLDESLRFDGLADVEAPVSEWARRPLPIDRLILAENEVNFLAFPALPRSAIAFGGGYSIVDRLPEVPWLRDRLIFYWGDIDTHGFGILDRLRKSFPSARSFLMDQETLLDHRRLWGTEDDPLAVALERLTADESELYDDLRRGRFGLNVRLEQERVAFPHVQRAIEWIEEASFAPFRRPTARGFVFDTEGTTFRDRPDLWVDSRETRSWVLGDPLLDWLERFGRAAGFRPDHERDGYDSRTDFRRFVQEKTAAFKAATVNLLRARATIVRPASQDRAAQAEETLELLRSGVAVVADAVLTDPERGAYSQPDLLVRSNVLATWFPSALSSDEASAGSPSLGHQRFHYRPLVLGFRTFDLTADGHVSTVSDQLVYAVQAWFHAQAIGRLQGHTLPCAYLLGRNWRQDDARGTGTLERLARVDVDRWLPQRDCTLTDVALAAAAWLRRLRREGSEWRVLPRPTVPELQPHARNHDDAPWHVVKRELAEELEELTLLPGMNPERRRRAHDAGLFRWRQEGVCAAALDVTSPVAAAQLEAVLEANRSAMPVVVPRRIETPTDHWRRVPAVEFFVDFETVTHLEDDLTDLPQMGGQSLIVQVGCGHVLEGAWSFAQWTVDALSPEEERRILDAWMVHMEQVCRAAGSDLGVSRVCHWSAAERVHLDTAFDNARQRHPTNAWPPVLPWFDVLQDVIRAAPVAVTGAFSFGLKAIAKAMHAAGFIPTTWPSGPTDGLGAMVGTWWAARESTELSKHPLMVDIARYNRIDCQVMMEILQWLRTNR